MVEAGADVFRYRGEPGEGEGRRAGQGGAGGGSRTLGCREADGCGTLEMCTKVTFRLRLFRDL